MKPTKNRYYCMACGHSKMLFETEKKAQNFIKFNSEEIASQKNDAPVRSYYCETCLGWHVTSNPNVKYFKNYKSGYEIALDLNLKANSSRYECTPSMEPWEIKLKEKLSTAIYPDNVRECINQANVHKDRKDILELAFSLTCDAFSRQLESDVVASSFMVTSNRLMKSLRKAWGNIGGDENLYNKLISLHAELNCCVVVSEPPTEEDLAHSEQKRKRKRMKKLSFRLQLVADRIANIVPCIENGMQSFAKMEISDMTRRLYDLSKYEEIKDSLIEQVDILIAARDLYFEKFGNL